MKEKYLVIRSVSYGRVEELRFDCYEDAFTYISTQGRDFKVGTEFEIKKIWVVR